MTDRKEALQALLAKVEAGETYLERDIQAVFGGYRANPSALYAKRAYEGSLDAAKALHDAVLPNRYWRLEEWDGAWTAQLPVSTFKRHEATSEESPARAWLLAILQALIAQEGEQ